MFVQTIRTAQDFPVPLVVMWTFMAFHEHRHLYRVRGPNKLDKVPLIPISLLEKNRETVLMNL